MILGPDWVLETVSQNGKRGLWDSMAFLVGSASGPEAHLFSKVTEGLGPIWFRMGSKFWRRGRRHIKVLASGWGHDPEIPLRCEKRSSRILHRGATIIK